MYEALLARDLVRGGATGALPQVFLRSGSVYFQIRRLVKSDDFCLPQVFQNLNEVPEHNI